MSHSHPKDTADEIRVDLQLMMQDAKLWANSAESTKTAASVADGMPLDQPTWSFAGDEACNAYQELQQWLAGMLESAAEKLEDMSMGLIKTAARYQRQDEETAENFNRLLRDHLG